MTAGPHGSRPVQGLGPMSGDPCQSHTAAARREASAR